MVIKPIFINKRDGKVTLDADAVGQLAKNGTYLPLVSKVLYNLKTEKKTVVEREDGTKEAVMEKLASPKLATKVFWSDGSTTTVVNSPDDGISTEKRKLSDGSEIEVATEESKELGLVYAVVKRTCGVPGADGEMENTGLGRILRSLVKSGIDKGVEKAEARIRKAALKAKSKNAAPAGKKARPKSVNERLAEAVEKLTEILGKAGQGA